MKVFRFMLVMALLTFAGCYRPSVYIQSKLETGSPIDKSGRIVIFDPNEADAPAADFYTLLRPWMERQGFQFTDFQEAAFFLFADVHEEIRGIPGNPSAPSDHYWNMTAGRMSVPRAVNPEKTLPYVKRYKVLKIRLTFCDLPMYKQDKQTVPVWQGRIEVEENYYRRNQEECIRTLLGYFGTEFEGHVRMK
jgi:hypothetical protein